MAGVAERLRRILHRFLADRGGTEVYRGTGGAPSSGFVSRRISGTIAPVRNGI